MRILLEETDITDACCEFDAVDTFYMPEHVQVDLRLINGTFSAQITNPTGTAVVSEQWLVDAISRYLAENYSFNPACLQIQLQFDNPQEGITAEVAVIGD